MNHIGLFEGIGGFSIAGHWAGWETIAWCEWSKFPQQVLRHHFSTADELHDVTKADFTIYRGRVDVLTGGFPCQPFSHAGQRRGTEDDRYLWPHMLRAIQECRPTWVVGENVAGLASMAFPARALGVDLCTAIEGEEAHRDMEAAGVLDSICADLEREGYEVQPLVVPACAVNAPHRRDRIWIIGYNAANCADARAENLRCERTDTVHGFVAAAKAGGISRPLPHASGHGLQRPDQPAQGQQLHGNGQPCHEPQPLHGGGAAADTCIEQCERSQQHRSIGETWTTESEGRQFGRPVCSHWEIFPTQPPVCGGDDGISEILDADALFEGKKGGRRTATAAYNHWRNETIRAYGNAIVPQVFHEIAKAINAAQP